MKILSLEGRHWKWRMHGGAISLAKMYQELKFTPDFFCISAVEAIYCDTFPLLPDRLAFGEHLRGKEREYHYYKTQEELCLMLEKYIQEFNQQQNREFSHHVRRYDWGKMVEFYDSEFEKLMKVFSSEC